MSGASHFDNATWVAESAPRWCASHHKSPLCENVRTNYEYDLSLAANAIFAAIFGLSLLANIVTVVVTRRAVAFSVAMSLGLFLEVLGYAGRLISYENPWSPDGFLMQIVTLTIGPAFLAAGVYLSLRRIVNAFGAENSRIPPAWYTRIFIPCDVISLLFQAVGGALASSASQSGESVDTGDNIMIVGLSFQVVTLVVFIAISGDFAIRIIRRRRALGAAALDQQAVFVNIRRSLKFKGFLGALALATVCILWRSIFRVAELSGGWTGPIMGRQDLFIGFEGVLIAIAVVALNIFHPAWCIKELLQMGGGLTGLWFARKKGAKTEKAVDLSERSSASGQYV